MQSGVDRQGAAQGPDQCLHAADMAANARLQVELEAGVRFVALAAGRYHSVGLSDAGRVYSWGLNDFGQLGRPARAAQRVSLGASPCVVRAHLAPVVVTLLADPSLSLAASVCCSVPSGLCRTLPDLMRFAGRTPAHVARPATAPPRLRCQGSRAMSPQSRRGATTRWWCLRMGPCGPGASTPAG